MLKVTATMGANVPLRDVVTHAKRVEGLGYDTLSVAEAVHDGMLSAMAALGATTRLRVSQGVLVAFARSPMLAAQGAWDRWPRPSAPPWSDVCVESEFSTSQSLL